MSKYLDSIEKVTMERLVKNKNIKNQFWYLFSYCKGLEYVVENFAVLGKEPKDNNECI